MYVGTARSVVVVKCSHILTFTVDLLYPHVQFIFLINFKRREIETYTIRATAGIESVAEKYASAFHTHCLVIRNPARSDRQSRSWGAIL